MLLYMTAISKYDPIYANIIFSVVFGSMKGKYPIKREGKYILFSQSLLIYKLLFILDFFKLVVSLHGINIL